MSLRSAFVVSLVPVLFGLGCGSTHELCDGYENSGDTLDPAWSHLPSLPADAEFKVCSTDAQSAEVEAVGDQRASFEAWSGALTQQGWELVGVDQKDRVRGIKHMEAVLHKDEAFLKLEVVWFSEDGETQLRLSPAGASDVERLNG
jgi:hypothetical protein